MKNKINFRVFYNYITSNNVLSGFNLTDELLQKLFAFIDPHKKGFISQSDWMRAFSKYINY